MRRADSAGHAWQPRGQLDGRCDGVYSVARIADAYGAFRGLADTTQLLLEYYTIYPTAPEAAPRLRDTHRITRDGNAPAVRDTALETSPQGG